ncbi:MAG TPA: hypothetical protein VGH80_07265 [Xanthomonadaceae bacterium]
MTKHLGLMLCISSACILGGCRLSDPLDDVSRVSLADRPALQKCLAAPDLPGNQWTPRAGKARCWLSLPQEPSLHEIAQTLQKPNGAATLDRQYAQILAEHYSDPAHRDFLFAAYQDFGTADGRKLAADWLAKSPNNPYAQLAQAEAVLAQAWTVRGNAYASETTDEQFEGMASQLRDAVPLLQSVLQAEPKLSPACVALMQIGSMVPDESLRVPATRGCMRVDPLSWHVNDQWMLDVDPRWKRGEASFNDLDRAIAQIRLHVKDSPMLGSLLAKGIGRRAYLHYQSSDLTPIATELDLAAHTAPDAFYLAKAGMALQQAHDPRKALDYVSQALRFSPNEPDFLIDRAELLESLGRGDEAHADARLAGAQKPEDCGCDDYYPRLATFYGGLDEVNDERVILQKDILLVKDHKWALTVLCQTYLGLHLDGGHALTCTRQLITEYPDDSEAVYLRALAFYNAHDPAAAEFDARYRSMDGRDNPNRAMEIQQLDGLKKMPVASNETSSRAP